MKFWQAVQSLWLTHMLVMSDENYPGPRVSFGRIDQFLYPFWQNSIQAEMDPEFGKDILKCFWVHANTAYDGMIRTGGNQGITAGYGQLLTLSGMGPNGQDMTNELTHIILNVIDEMSPILEPKPNVRLHRGTPDDLLDKVVQMIADSQGAPFLLNFDEHSMAGMLLQAKKAGVEHLINNDNVHEYAPVGCLENTMVGHEVLQARAKHKAPKYGRDDEQADALAYHVMQIWSEETWQHKTRSTQRQFRPGMLSWNYWVADSFVLPASADGRPRGQFLSNALCPSNGADIHGPTANVNSVGKVLGGKAPDGMGDWEDYINLLPNGGSHTMSFSPSLVRDPEHKQKFKGFLRGYIENGGTAL
ncbi:MAG: hypothetical protein CVU41_06995 [Chloroflexi bacterium HGW-Chloroflexi-3]|nr:MAG: hypothetical protein CVU41_06995 [Chloroflexi bacterium HGW-Chloroflexi-3]